MSEAEAAASATNATAMFASPADVLDRTTRVRSQREDLDAELALLIDHAVARHL
jgi:hypothetical protein